MLSLTMSLLASLALASELNPRQQTRTVMVHLFEWKWTDVARECQEYLGPNGFAAVQVSPPNEHDVIEGFPWYQRYQPVSYKLESRSGTRDEFHAMVQACKASGVDIYVDAVINHMAGVLPEGQQRTGSAGSSYSRYGYSDYSYQDFHHCGRNGDNQIRNYQDRWEVQNCELFNLADLDTESTYVRSRLSDYLNDLVGLGVAGFRIDAAKHVATTSIRNILDQVRGHPYVYQEVIDQGGEPIGAAEYFQNGDVTEFKYGQDLSRVFRDGHLAWFGEGEHKFGEGWGYVPSDRAIVFVDNHDTQRGHGPGGGVLTYKESTLYRLATVFMLAWPYGYPQLMSSYAFGSSWEGPPSDPSGHTRAADCAAGVSAGWVCEHRWPGVAAMVKFRNSTASEFHISNWWSNGFNQIAFGRGRLGFVVINNEDTEMRQTLATDLPAGRYCNILASTDCKAGEEIVVTKQGRASAQAHFVLPPRSAVVLIRLQRQ